MKNPLPILLAFVALLLAAPVPAQEFDPCDIPRPDMPAIPPCPADTARDHVVVMQIVVDWGVDITNAQVAACEAGKDAERARSIDLVILWSWRAEQIETAWEAREDCIAEGGDETACDAIYQIQKAWIEETYAEKVAEVETAYANLLLLIEGMYLMDVAIANQRFFDRLADEAPCQ